jgi:hypothetical protein
MRWTANPFGVGWSTTPVERTGMPAAAASAICAFITETGTPEIAM